MDAESFADSTVWIELPCAVDDALPCRDLLIERLPRIDGDRILFQGDFLAEQEPPTRNQDYGELDVVENESQCHLLAPQFDGSCDPSDAMPDASLPSRSVFQSQFIEPSNSYACGVACKIVGDHLHYYSPGSLTSLAAAFSVGAVMAHTVADEHLYEELRENLLSDAAHEYREFIADHKFLGEGHLLLPAYALIAYAGLGVGDAPLVPSIGEWGERSFRAILVGGPPLLMAQLLTGGSRPGETDHESQWRPLADDNGVSGHAFIGSIPLLSAAKMSDRISLKLLLLSASMLPALSRITDDAHYPSQAMLGWTMAYIAATAVDSTNQDCQPFAVSPWVSGDAIGISGMWQR